MKSTLIALAALAALAGLGLTAPAQAAGLGLTRDIGVNTAVDAPLLPVHLRHTTCQWDRYGWHRSAYRGLRTSCRPFATWRDRRWR